MYDYYNAVTHTHTHTHTQTCRDASSKSGKEYSDAGNNDAEDYSECEGEDDDGPLPPGWRRALREDSGTYYWWNEQTKKSSRVRPTT